MPARDRVRLVMTLWAFLGCGTMSTGCLACGNGNPPVDNPIPRELKKVSLPPYLIEPPDVLRIDALSIVPRPPYRIAPLDTLLIQVSGTLANEPIGGVYGVEPEGTLSLVPSYGTISVAGLTLEEARALIETQLKQFLKEPKVFVALAQSHSVQQIRGEHLVSQDGTVNLGVYGLVSVVGLTVPQAKAAIERHLAQYLLNPQVSVIVSGYNSKVYYVIFDGGGYGQQLFRLPITGNETVLDAISQLNGLPPVASLKDIRIARPAPDELACDQILPVDWKAITERGATATNYQILPGDRIQVKADRLITLDNTLAKMLAPIERVFGITLLGSSSVRAVEDVNPHASSGSVAP